MEKQYSPSTWSAWYNVMPGSPHTLHVIGTITVPTTGYHARLTAHIPPGINPTIYLLDLIVTPPAAGTVVEQTITKLEVEPYEEETETRYLQVTILPIGETVHVKTVS